MGGLPEETVEGTALNSITSCTQRKGKYWRLYSGLLVLPRRQITLSHEALRQAILAVRRTFSCVVLGHVRAHV